MDHHTITIGGTHLWINEPDHPGWSKDCAYNSHKLAKTGHDYEFRVAFPSPIGLDAWAI